MSEELQPGQTFAGYRIEAVAGRGGMGVVYRATQLALGRTVALKLIAPEHSADEAFRERMLRESRLLASIEHRNVVAFYEAGEAEGLLFISMCYVDGMDLRALIAARGRLAPEYAARILAQVAAGLDAAHAGGLVHRDVKPANVLIEQRGATQRAYLSDFGLMKNLNPATAITRSGDLVGTVDYIAPEQIDGRRVDARTDVYALGCVLFEALTGRVAYVRESDPAKLWAHLHEAPPSACDLRPELPAEVDLVIARAMAKDPAQRYKSAGDLGRAAIAAAGGEAVTEPGRSVAAGAAAPAPPAEAARGAPADAAEPAARRSALRRHPVLAVVGCAAVLGACALTAAALVVPGDRQPSVERLALGGLAIPSKIVADENAAYVLDEFVGSVIKLDRASGKVDGRVQVGKSSVDIATDPFDKRLWVVNRENETVSEIDPQRGEIVGSPVPMRPNPASLAVFDDEVVALTQRRDGFRLRSSVQRVSKKTHRRVGDPVALDADIADDLVAGGPGFAVLTALPPAISTYGPQLERVAQVQLGTYQERGVPIEAALERESSVAWVLFAVAGGPDQPDGPSDRQVVLRIDTTTGNQIGGAVEVGPGSHDLAVDRGVLWVPSTKNQSVTRIDTRSGRVIGQPLEVGATNGAVAASAGVAWVGGEKDVIRITPR